MFCWSYPVATVKIWIKAGMRLLFSVVSLFLPSVFWGQKSNLNTIRGKKILSSNRDTWPNYEEIVTRRLFCLQESLFGSSSLRIKIAVSLSGCWKLSSGIQLEV